MQAVIRWGEEEPIRTALCARGELRTQRGGGGGGGGVATSREHDCAAG